MTVGGGCHRSVCSSSVLILGAAMYFLMIRPQRRRQDQAALQSAIEVGDEVMTTSGVYGFVTGFDGDIAWLEIDDNVQIRVARAAVQRKVDTARRGATASDRRRARAEARDRAAADEHADDSADQVMRNASFCIR